MLGTIDNCALNQRDSEPASLRKCEFIIETPASVANDARFKPILQVTCDIFAKACADVERTVAPFASNFEWFFLAPMFRKSIVVFEPIRIKLLS